MRIIDSFPFFAPTGKELLKLRVELYKDVVDNFIIVESNKTHSGKPVPFRFEEMATELGLPLEKIIYIPHHIPDTPYLETREVDRANASTNQSNEASVQARARERMQKDAVMQALHLFDDQDVVIYGDADEIIDPKHIRWVSNVVARDTLKYDAIMKIPLVFLQGRANLRVWDISRDNWYPWNNAMFISTKAQIMKYKISNLRCGNCYPLKTTWPRSHGQSIPEMGWHFAWMGSGETRKVKAQSFAHAHDKFKEMEYEKGFEDKSYQEWLSDTVPQAGKPAPGGNSNHFLKNYPHENLPDIVFKDEMISSFLLPYEPEVL
jgi:beta-1,4-mannosyl-glycoprotein beta-1,4-N-acetylglucosaminyltransferase